MNVNVNMKIFLTIVALTISTQVLAAKSVKVVKQQTVAVHEPEHIRRPSIQPPSRGRGR